MSVRRYSPTYQCPEDWSDDSAMVACDDGLYVLASDDDAAITDAMRYRWLRDAVNKPRSNASAYIQGEGGDMLFEDGFGPEKLDAAIDGLMASTTREKP
jgi:hypothetical protein